MPYKLKAVMFDLDGTLLHTEPDLAHAVNHALAKYGFPLRTHAEITSYLGAGMLALVKRAVPIEMTEKELLEFKQCFLEEYEKHDCDLTVPYEGITELLDLLIANGVKLAVVSNKDEHCAVPIVKHYFGERFSSIRGVRDASDKKPSPKTALETLEALGITQKEAVFVGDGKADILTARNAGIECIAVSYGYAEKSCLEAEYGKEAVPDVKALTKILLAEIC